MPVPPVETRNLHQAGKSRKSLWLFRKRDESIAVSRPGVTWQPRFAALRFAGQVESLLGRGREELEAWRSRRLVAQRRRALTAGSASCCGVSPFSRTRLSALHLILGTTPTAPAQWITLPFFCLVKKKQLFVKFVPGHPQVMQVIHRHNQSGHQSLNSLDFPMVACSFASRLELRTHYLVTLPSLAFTP